MSGMINGSDLLGNVAASVVADVVAHVAGKVEAI